MQKLLTAVEVAAVLRCSPKTVRRMATDRIFTHAKVHGRILIAEQELQRYLDARTVKSPLSR